MNITKELLERLQEEVNEQGNTVPMKNDDYMFGEELELKELLERLQAEFNEEANTAPMENDDDIVGEQLEVKHSLKRFFV